VRRSRERIRVGCGQSPVDHVDHRVHEHRVLHRAELATEREARLTVAQARRHRELLASRIDRARRGNTDTRLPRLVA
jgi:hypothetical protein